MKRRCCHEEMVAQVPARIRPALGVLFEARQYAEQTSGNYWEFAVELHELAAMGLTRNDFRWLVRKGLVEHKRDVTLEGDDGRTFRPTGDLSFPDGTCFVLTPAGASIATGIGEDIQSNASCGENDPHSPTLVPHWNADARELCMDGKIVKRFKWHAVNQEIILTAFEEEGWPVRIDDPLPPHAEQDSKRRLSDTIKCLNRKQMNELIHFRGDGTGEGVIWERLAHAGSNDLPSRGDCSPAQRFGNSLLTRGD
jgi:hypothetical protein